MGMKNIKYNSPVILTYTIVCFLTLLMSYATNGISNKLLFSVYRTSFTNPLAYLRVFTHILGHQNFEHFFNNFLIILLVGPMIEEKYGSKPLLIMIASAALITGIFSLIFSPHAMLLGASGVGFMLILLSSYVNFEEGKIPLTLIVVVVIFLGKEAYSQVTTVDNISHATHLIGGIIGAILGYFMNKKISKKISR